MEPFAIMSYRAGIATFGARALPVDGEDKRKAWNQSGGYNPDGTDYDRGSFMANNGSWYPGNSFSTAAAAQGNRFERSVPSREQPEFRRQCATYFKAATARTWWRRSFVGLLKIMVPQSETPATSFSRSFRKRRAILPATTACACAFSPLAAELLQDRED